MHKIFALLTGETFVLIAALLLFAYVKKNEIGKWLQFGAAAVAIFMMVLMIGSVFTCCMPCYGGFKGGHDGGKEHCKMKGNDDDNCCMMNNNMGCSKGGSNSCPMDRMEDDCCSKGGMDKCNMEDMKEIQIEINDDGNGKDTIEKKVIIKKNAK